MEAYVDDMIIRSRSKTTHLEDLEEAFLVMRAHNLKLSPRKRAFHVVLWQVSWLPFDALGDEATQRR